MTKFEEIKEYFLSKSDKLSFTDAGDNVDFLCDDGFDIGLDFDGKTQKVIEYRGKDEVVYDPEVEEDWQELVNIADDLATYHGVDYGVEVDRSEKIFILHGCTHRATKGKRAVFKVNKDEKTVTCTLVCTADVRDKMSMFSKIFNLYVPKKQRTIKTTITVKCQDGDEFDEEFGKRLAFAKARVSCLKMFKALIVDLEYKLEEVLSSIHDESFRYNFSIDQHIEDSENIINMKYNSDAE